MADMKLIDIAWTKEERKEHNLGPLGTSDKDDGPAYPYWAKLNIDRESLKKLGIDPDDAPEIGDEYLIEGEATITSVRIELRESDDDSFDIAFQITKLGLKKNPEVEREKEDSKRMTAALSPTDND